MLKCPVCNEKLNKIDCSYKCKNGHSFDIAKQGYINLLRKNSINHGDNKGLVQARTYFLNTGKYDNLKNEINKIIDKYHPKNMIDLGCGEGYYTKSFKVDELYGIDISKEAIAYASKNDKKNTYIVGSIFDLPFDDHSFDMALEIFAPCPTDEIKRILKKDGIFIEVVPGPYHLYELKKALYDNVRLNDIRNNEELSLIESRELNYYIDVNQEELMSLFKMTPYSYKTAIDKIEKISKIDKLNINISFIVNIYTLNKN